MRCPLPGTGPGVARFTRDDISRLWFTGGGILLVSPSHRFGVGSDYTHWTGVDSTPQGCSGAPSGDLVEIGAGRGLACEMAH